MGSRSKKEIKTLKKARTGQPRPRGEAGSRWRDRGFLFDVVIIVGLVALTVGVLWPVVRCGFVIYDDPIWVTDNHRVQQGLSVSNIGWAFTQAYGYWTPIDLLSHMLDCHLFGLNPAGHHATNLFLHTANVVLLFVLLRAATGRPWCSAVAAALFAIHPLNVEPVAWITSRKDVLSTLFGLLTLLAYAHYGAGERGKREKGKKGNHDALPVPLNSLSETRYPEFGTRCLIRYMAVVALFAASLMVKPAFLPLPFALLLLDYWPLKRMGGLDAGTRDGRKRLYRLLAEKAPLLALAIVFAAVDYVLQRRFGAIETHPRPFSVQTGNAIVSYAMYIWKAVWPTGLAVPYPYETAIPWWKTAAALALLLGLTGGAVIGRKRFPYVFAGWFWFGLILAPVCGLFVSNGDFVRADRYAYVSMIGIFVIVAWALGDLMDGEKRKRGKGGKGEEEKEEGDKRPLAISVVVVSGLAAFAVVAHGQVRYWRDSDTLFNRALAVTRNNIVAYTNLGAASMGRGNYDQAEAYFKKAIEVDPQCAYALNNMGRFYLVRDHYEQAKSYLTKALEFDPQSRKALVNLGCLFLNQGRYEDAERYLRKALEIEPREVDALGNLGMVLLRQGRVEEAKSCSLKALEIDPSYDFALDNLGVAFMQEGQYEEAKRYLTKALEANPRCIDALNNLGTLSLRRENYEEALRYLKQALEFEPKSCVVLDNLGFALSRLGRNEEARRYLLDALERNPELPDALTTLGELSLQDHRYEEAQTYLAKALKVNPRAVQALDDLAWLYATCPDTRFQDGAKAVEYAERAITEAQSLPGASAWYQFDVLAAAQARLSQFDRAVSMEDKAVAAAKTATGVSRSRQQTIVADLERKMRLYKSGHALVDEAKKSAK